MATHQFRTVESIIPTEKEIKLARQSSKILASEAFKKAKAVDIVLEKSKKKHQNIAIPLSAFKLLVSILTHMSEGNTITLTPVNAELTTQQAADLLNVSRPYLIQLLEAKKIAFRKVGTRRKILYVDVMRYKAKTDGARRKVLDELAEDAQALKLGY